MFSRQKKTKHKNTLLQKNGPPWFLTGSRVSPRFKTTVNQHGESPNIPVPVVFSDLMRSSAPGCPGATVSAWAENGR